jgi:hypothetical protein
METKLNVRPTEVQNEENYENVQQLQMKPGTYMLHIFIEEARSLLPPNKKELCDPVFTVTAFGVTKSSKEFRNISAVSQVQVFEHLYIEGKDKQAEEVLNERLVITVRDNSFIESKKNIIGTHEVDLTYIYSNPNHGVVHRWTVLSNPEDSDFGSMKGYLKVGLSLTHETDKPVDLSKKENPSEKDKDLLIPPHVTPKAVQLIIHLLKAENLPKMDRTSTIDCYCLVRFAAAECKSSVFKADEATMSAYWCEEIMIPVLTPCVTNTVTLTFWDHDSLTKDDLVGGITLNFELIQSGRLKSYFWTNIYGAPPLSEGEQADFMNRVPSCASHWRGRILLRAWVEEGLKETYKKCFKIKDPKIPIFIRDEFETGDDFEVRTQVISASALPFKSGKYSVRIEWSGISSQSLTIETKNGCVDWSETLKRGVTMIPKGCEDILPDVFVYLLYDNVKICYVRIPAKSCSDKAKEARWRQLVPEKTTGKIKDDWNAGFIKVRIFIGKYCPGNDDIEKNNWKKVEKMKPEEWFLYVHIFQCRDLPAADKNGLADPYVNIYCAGEEVSTRESPRECTLNPRWYETFELRVKIPSIKDAPPIILYIFDHDVIGSDDILGVTFINLIEGKVEPENVPRPTWRKISLGRKGTEKGEILASLSIFKKQVANNFEILPEFEDKNIQINILGLRDLKPALGWLPVNKAFIKFDLNSLTLPGETIGLKSVETQPFESGNDPNINSTVSFKCKMPNDRIYCSYLTATVHDYLFNGLSQPLIGSFCIDLGAYTSKYVQKSVLSYGITYSRLRAEKKKTLRGISEVSESDELEEAKKEEKREKEEKEEKKDEDQDFVDEEVYEAVNKSVVNNEITTEIEEEKEFIQESQEKIVSRSSSKNKIVPDQSPEFLTVRFNESGRPKSFSEEENLRIKESIKELEKLKGMTFEEIIEHPTFVKRKAIFKTKKMNQLEEVCIPDPDKYKSIGYNRKSNEDLKYYRFFIDEPLENTSLFSTLPFEELTIYKGQERGLEDSLFDFEKRKDASGEKTSLEKVGTFKFLIKMTDYPPPAPDESEEFYRITKKLLNRSKCIVRVYVIDAFDLEQKDKLSKSDPYVRVKLGTVVQDAREHYQEDVDDPSIYRVFELPAVLPGKSTLKVQLWDYNSLTSDTKIGTTRIDLEDRFFNEKWIRLEEKPIETRPLFLKSSRRPQGFVRLWVEILESRSKKPVENIAIRPPGEFEARVIIWKACEVPSMDIEGLTDAFVTVKLNNSEEKETDTHFRSGRNPSWNWRMKFNLMLSDKTTSNLMKIQLWDRDVLSGNDFISEGVVDFNDIAKKAWEENSSSFKTGPSDDLKERMMGKESHIFWVQCKAINDNREEYNRGRVLISLELVPRSKAESVPVGEGRSEPNVHPFLPPPTGRFQLSLNPCKMYFQLVGPEFRTKCCLIFCCLLMVLIMFLIVPILISDEISRIL